MTNQVTNTYFYFRDDFSTITQQFNPLIEGSMAEFGYSYIEGVLRAFEQTHQNRGLVVYVTVWTVHRLPTYGANVIAFIMQDEWSREPKYRDKVGAVFHACGLRPVLLRNLQYGSMVEKVANVLGYLRTIYQDGISGRIRSMALRLAGKKLAPLYDFPLGYYANDQVDFIEFENRELILSFAGSVQHRMAKVKVPSPKELARERMVKALTTLAANHPDLSINHKKTTSYKASIQDTQTYSSELINSKFCLVPRGANLETFRFYEAIRFGCIPIMEVIPNTPFYQGAPIIRLSNWSELEPSLLELLTNPIALKKMHTDVLKWWSDVCSEQAVAKQVGNYVDSRPVKYL